jgi:hypothetical protein
MGELARVERAEGEHGDGPQHEQDGMLGAQPCDQRER